MMKEEENFKRMTPHGAILLVISCNLFGYACKLSHPNVSMTTLLVIGATVSLMFYIIFFYKHFPWNADDESD